MAKRQKKSKETTSLKAAEAGSGEQPSTVNRQPTTTPAPALLSDMRQLIAAAREQTARVVNTGLVMMYWHIGRRIGADVLKHERAEYGQEIVQTLSAQLTAEFGRGFGR